MLHRATLTSVINIVNDRFAFTTPLAVALAVLGSPTLLCIFGSRMFFNLKEAAEHGVNVGTNWSSYSGSTIRFEDGKPHSQFVDPLICFELIRLQSEYLLRQDVSTMQFSESHSGDIEYVN